MAVLPIRVLGDPVLRQETTPVTTITPELRTLVADMFDTMYAAEGIGLAAPQVGRTERLAVVDVHGEKYVLFNPEIVHREGRITWEEGCLSIPEILGDVERAHTVTVRAMDLEGQTYEVTAGDLLGVCFQHEIDHLHGKLFLDHLGYFTRQKKLKEWEREKKRYPDGLRHLTPRPAGEATHPSDDEAL